MPLTNQPYLPLYVKDWLTNNKLKFCSEGSHGLLINIMCLMHKENEYGTLLLNQKYKQTNKQIENFALMLARLLPFEKNKIEILLNELINEEVLKLDNEKLICNRMVKDAQISEIRAISGSKGGKKTQFKKNKKFAKAKIQANTENEIEYENINKDIIEIINYLNKVTGKNFRTSADKTRKVIKVRLNEGFTLENFKTVILNRAKKWLTDKKMNEYLRPETLFGTKFESYLNEQEFTEIDSFSKWEQDALSSIAES